MTTRPRGWSPKTKCIKQQLGGRLVYVAHFAIKTPLPDGGKGLIREGVKLGAVNFRQNTYFVRKLKLF
jgi:hypothetical protein